MKIIPGLEAEYAEYKRINADDDYGASIVSYGENWAMLMEEHIASAPDAPVANTILLCAKETSLQAGTATGFMHGAAVSALAKFWEHGEILRNWHNNYLSPEQAAEANAKGVTLNPAMIIGSDV
jgi:hypothetical protein